MNSEIFWGQFFNEFQNHPAFSGLWPPTGPV
jgi:hypothetical protein